MKCVNCGEETNPTLRWCQVCGVPTDTDVSDVLRDEAEKEREARLREGIDQARRACTLALFLLSAVFGLRLVLLRTQSHDQLVGYRAPVALLGAGVDPKLEEVPVDALEVPYPETKGKE